MASLLPVTGTLGVKRAAHLLRRSTFGPTRKDIDDFSTKTADEAITALFTDVTVPSPPVDPKTNQTWLNPKVTSANSDPEVLMNYFKAWHLERMRKSGNSIKEKITFFYHAHIPTRWSVVQSTEAIYYQNALYRYYAFGSFKALFQKVCLDNANLINLDGALNDVDSPNENFAREMFELYTIGKGPQIGDGNYTNYTEADIKAAAKVLSGYKNDDTYTNQDTDTHIPSGMLITDSSKAATRHDASAKTFSSAFGGKVIQPSQKVGNYATDVAALGELSDLITMIFDQPETAKFIARKLYRFFVYYDITSEIETDIVVPLADLLRSNNYNISIALKTLLKSQHFYDADDSVTSNDNIGAIIKSPIDLVLGMLRFFEITIPDETTQLSKLYDTVYRNGVLDMFHDMGIDFYEPLDVAGYEAYYQVPTFNRFWITTLTLANRYVFAEQLISGVNKGNTDLGIKLDIVKFVDNTTHVSNPSDPTVLVKELTDYLLAVEMSTDRFNYFLNTILLDTFPLYYWTNEWNSYKSTQNDSTVRIQLEKLVVALMQSPEFQLM